MSRNPLFERIRIYREKKDAAHFSRRLHLCVLLFSFITLFVMTACGESETVVPAESRAEIRLNSYIKTGEPEGYNGSGTINAEIDKESLCADLAEKIRTVKDADPQLEALRIADIIRRQFYLSNTQNLKNGDRIEIVWLNWKDEAEQLEQEYGISLIYENTVITVTGLKEPESIDPFANLKVVFQGFDEYGTLEWESSDIYGFTYSFSKKEHLSNGEKITAELLLPEDEPADSYLERTGIRLTGRTCEYTVQNLAPLVETDPFEYVAVQYSGREPDGEAVFTYSPPAGSFPSLSLETDRFTGLSNGDTVTLTFSAEESAETYEPAFGIRLTRLTADYTVKGLSGYVTSLKSIPAEMLGQIDTDAAKWVENNDFKELGSSAELKDLKTIGHFLLVSGNGSAENYFGVIFKATVAEGKSEYVCYPFTFVIGLGMEEDGSYTTESEMMRAHFSITVKGKKGTYVLYGAGSLDEIKKEFLEPAGQRFFVRTETDF